MVTNNYPRLDWLDHITLVSVDDINETSCTYPDNEVMHHCDDVGTCASWKQSNSHEPRGVSPNLGTPTAIMEDDYQIYGV